ncbi:hypothetical protein KR059_001452, partial [Drosophila kikkawai]
SNHTMPIIQEDPEEPERCCWICFATDEDNRLAAWVKPCQCRGSTKWVHQSCLYRWIDEKMNNENENNEPPARSVSCPQCLTEYILEFPQMGTVGLVLEALETFMSRICPYLMAGFFISAVYWTASSFGAVTLIQLLGYEQALPLMQACDPLFLVFGLPFIPIGLVLCRLICWQDAVLRVIQGREIVVRRNMRYVRIIYITLNQEDEIQELEEQQGIFRYPTVPIVSEPPTAARVFFGAILLPTISCTVGKILFNSVETTFLRTLLGGFTFIAVKGILKIYLRYKQYVRRKNLRIMDYTEENIRTYMPQ